MQAEEFVITGKYAAIFIVSFHIAMLAKMDNIGVEVSDNTLTGARKHTHTHTRETFELCTFTNKRHVRRLLDRSTNESKLHVQQFRVTS
jgi:hypothetical protein